METEELERLSLPARALQMTIGGFLHKASSWLGFSFSTMQDSYLHDMVTER